MKLENFQNLHNPGAIGTLGGVEYLVWLPVDEGSKHTAHRCDAETGDPYDHEQANSLEAAMKAARFPKNVRSYFEAHFAA